MSTPVCYVLLVCAGAGVVAEIIALLMPDRILEYMQPEPAEKMVPGPFLYVLGILSIMYIGAVVAMFASGDPIFRWYALALLAMSTVTWLLRKRFARWRALMVVDSVICLIVLIDVIRTVVRCIV